MPITNLVLSGEKKRTLFYLAYIQNFCPKDLIRFYSFPLGGQTKEGYSQFGSSMFDGTLFFQNEFALTVEFTSAKNEETLLNNFMVLVNQPENLFS
jgi:hypothetical protein